MNGIEHEMINWIDVQSRMPFKPSSTQEGKQTSKSMTGQSLYSDKFCQWLKIQIRYYIKQRTRDNKGKFGCASSLMNPLPLKEIQMLCCYILEGKSSPWNVYTALFASSGVEKQTNPNPLLIPLSSLIIVAEVIVPHWLKCSLSSSSEISSSIFFTYTFDACNQ